VTEQLTLPATREEQEGGQQDRNEALYNRVLALSDNVLSSMVERERPSKTAKKMSEVELCGLLGYCGLGWSDRHLLPSKIWTDLLKQPDRSSREAVLTALLP
jgi:hypothetical protein